MDPFWHGELISNFIEHNEGKNKVIILPRASGKTAVITTTYPVWQICKNPFALVQITNAAEDKAAAFTSTVAAILVKTPRLKKMFPMIKPTPGKWSMKGYKLDTEYIMKYMRDQGLDHEGAIERTDFTLKSYGMRGNITGAHVILQLHDDLISHEVAQSPALLARCEAFLREAFRVVDAHGEVLVAGTRWLYSDFYGKLLDNQLTANGRPWQILKHGIYKSDGTLAWPQRTFVDIGGKMSVSGYTDKQVEGFKADPFFAALYLCEPKQEGTSELDTSMIQVYDDLPFPVGFIDRVVFETNGAGEMMANSFIDQCRREGRHEIRVGKIKAPRAMNKQARIVSLLGAEVNSGRVHIPRELWAPNSGLGAQMREFGATERDDLLDATAYVCKLARDSEEPNLPRPVIMIDPSWAGKKTSDGTAIVCGVRVKGDLWILDAREIRTARNEVLAQEIFRMYYQWNNKEKKSGESRKKVYNGVRGFKSLTSRSVSRRGRIRNGGFTVDLSLIGYKK